jgi:hypothetical protein
VQELAPGIWHWKTPHPAWSQSEPWEQEVSSYAIDDGERLLLFDPLANDVVLWLKDKHAVVAGDTLVDFGQGLEIPAQRLREGVTREETAEPLRPLLELPVEHVLPAHGAPTGRSALERALG